VISELLIGCGSDRTKKLVYGGRSDWGALTTLDHNPDHKPDVVWDLNNLPLPFEDDSFDEIHAMEVLEHVGRQGDWRFFFDQFVRLLAHAEARRGAHGHLSRHPSSVWAWADPSHTRVIAPETFIFLSQPNYRQVGATAMSDFRNVYRADFDLIHSEMVNDTSHAFVLQAVKPARIDV
jgi:hypothetical protein